MRSVILNSQTIVTTGFGRKVLNSREGVTRAMGLRAMRLFLEHTRDRHADHAKFGKPAHLVAVPGAALMSEPTSSGDTGPRRCWQPRRSLASRAYAGCR
jgi:hypothetical protein